MTTLDSKQIIAIYPCGLADFVGRRDFIKQIIAQLKATDTPPILVKGLSGIGKTSFLNMVEATLQRDPTNRVLKVDANFLSWTILDELLSSLKARPKGSWGVVLQAPVVGGPAITYTREGRENKNDALVDCLRRIAKRKRILILVDNIQDARDADILTLRRLWDLKLGRFLFTLRSDAPSATSASAILNEWCKSMSLGPMSIEDCSALFQKLCPHIKATTADLRRLHAITGGYPYDIVLLAVIARTQQTDLGAVLKRLQTAALREVPTTYTHKRLFDNLSDLHWFLLPASTCRNRIDITCLMHLTGRSLVSLNKAVRRLSDMGVLIKVGPKIMFSHPLLHKFIYSQLEEQVRCLFHKKAAEYYTSLTQDPNLEELVEWCHHADRSAENTLQLASHTALSEALLDQGLFSDALPVVEKTLNLAKMVGLVEQRVRILFLLGETERSLARYKDAMAHFQEAAKLARTHKLKVEEGSCLCGLGSIYRSYGDFDEALKYYKKAQNLLREKAGAGTLAHLLWCMGEVYWLAGKYKQSRKMYGLARIQAEKTPILLARRGDAEWGIGGAYRAEGKYEEADRWYDRALNSYKRAGNIRGQAYTYWTKGEVCRLNRQLGAASTFYRKAYLLFRRIGNLRGEAYPLWGLGMIAIKKAAFKDAKRYFELSLKISKQIRNRFGIGKAQEGFGRLAAEQGKNAEATRCLQNAKKIFETIGSSEEAKRIRKLISSLKKGKKRQEVQKQKK